MKQAGGVINGFNFLIWLLDKHYPFVLKSRASSNKEIPSLKPGWRPSTTTKRSHFPESSNPTAERGCRMVTLESGMIRLFSIKGLDQSETACQTASPGFGSPICGCFPESNQNAVRPFWEGLITLPSDTAIPCISTGLFLYQPRMSFSVPGNPAKALAFRAASA